MKIVRQKKLYLYPQRMAIHGDDWWCRDHKLRNIIVEHELQEGDLYKQLRDLNISYQAWEEKNWCPILEGFEEKDFNKQNDERRGRYDIQRVSECFGWEGIYELLPAIIPNNYLEFVITVEYDSENCYLYTEEKSKKTIKVKSPEFVTKHQFYVLNNNDSIILGWKNRPFYEIDDGYVKWDVGDRANGTSISEDSPLADLFAESKTDTRGAYIPYKAKVKVEGYIRRIGYKD